MMGEESDYLSSQGDDGAERDMDEFDREQRRKARAERAKIKAAVAEEIRRQFGRSLPQSVNRGARETYQCRCCGQNFSARVADRKRGWAKYCSKSCKAIIQDVRTGGVYCSQYEG